MSRSEASPSLPRRALLAIGTATAAGALAGAAPAAPVAPVALAARPPKQPRTAAEAWAALVAGNRRFATGHQVHPHEQLAWRQTLLAGQHPFACVLGCADSRVPPELVFDHGLGDLFTVRAVGEVLDEAVVGSIEYAVEHLDVPLLVVLGHARCGAVSAAVELVRGDSDAEFAGAVSTVARAIEATVLATPPNPDRDAFLAACVSNQAIRVAEELPHRSAALRDAVDAGRLEIVPAVYDLGDGLVSRS